MHRYSICITLPDGSQSAYFGLYDDGFAAVSSAMERFPAAQRISARRMA